MAVAHPRMIFSIRPRSRLVVSGFSVQIGFRILSTWSTVTLSTAGLPMTGLA
jgi:hypothetical protein